MPQNFFLLFQLQEKEGSRFDRKAEHNGGKVTQV
jgi:hypothetical protein